MKSLTEQTSSRTQSVSVLAMTTWVASLSLLLVSITTFGLWLLGPEATPVRNPEALWPEQAPFAISEPTDRLIFASWILIPLGIIGLAWRLREKASFLNGKPAVFVQLSLLAGGLFASVLAVAVSDDPWGYWAGLPIRTLILGVALTALAVASYFLRGGLQRLSVVLASIVAVAFVLPAMLNTADHVRDPYHFAFTGDELAAPAVGKYPLVNYTPQYSILLGYPIAPVLRAFPEYATSLALAWLFVLQLVVILIIYLLPVLIGGSRVFTSVVVIATPPLIFSGVGGSETPLSYFATIPMRTVLPLLLFVVAILLLSKVTRDRPTLSWFGLIGLGAGIVVLNNLDFGAPAALIVLVAVALRPGSWSFMLQRTIVFVATAVLVGVTYVLAMAALGYEVQWEGLILYPRTFAIDGFFQVPMPGFGVFVLAVALFASALIVGFLLQFVRKDGNSQRQTRMALALFLTGGWSLMTMSYFAGRSFLPTFFGGLAVQMALVAGTFIPLAFITLRRFRQLPWMYRLPILTPVIWAAVMGVTLTSLWAFVRTPSEALEILEYADSSERRISRELQSLMSNDKTSQESNAIPNQMLVGSNLTELEMGWESALGVNSPEVFSISPVFTSLQCKSMPRKVRRMIVDETFGKFLLRDPACNDVLNFTNVQTVELEGRIFQIIPVTTPN